ncbi:Flp pilus assembly protein CpaB [Celeribacter arenosi]|uniref:Flp pilus assembly protein CpaB n=1 Tax=Celeribacter arenosi TaxID=792649 RepID=A0ABP7KAT4_9RHOB
MRIVFGLVLIVGMVMAGFAVKMTKGYMSTYQAQLAEERAKQSLIIKTEDIYVVTQQLRYGDRVTSDVVKLIQWPANSVPKGAFKTEKDLFPEGTNVPRIALRTIEALEPLMTVKVTRPGEDAGVAARLSKGMRAFAIRVDVSTGVSGFLRPGDKVDVYWTGSLPGSRSDVTKLIQSSVELVAIDQMADGERQTPTVARTVTVEVSPQQVAALAQAQSTGRLSLSLVGRNDDTITADVEIDQRGLLGIEEVKQVAEAPKEKVCTVRTRKGSDLLETRIPCPE